MSRVTRKTRSVRALVVLALALATVTATAPALAGDAWQAGGGAAEPSTEYDTPDVMWQHAPAGPVDRVYFNAFLVAGGWIGGADANPAGGSIVTPAYGVAAFLGYWRDCNGDGYVGARTVPAVYAVTTGAWSGGAYPTSGQEIDRSACDGEPFHHGAFVDEFRWIGPDASPSEKERERRERFACDPAQWITILEDCTRAWKDPFDVDDPGARVWADRWRPPLVYAPVPPWDPFKDSESTLHLVDRHVQPLVHGTPLQPVWDTPRPNVGACGGEAEFRFVDDPSDTCGLYPLWQARRLVNDSAYGDKEADPLVSVFDTGRDDDGSGTPCDDAYLPGGLRMADVDPSANPDPVMDGSIMGTLANVESGTGGFTFSGSCGANKYTTQADPFAAPRREGKNTVDAWLEYQPGTRHRGLRSAGVDYIPLEPPVLHDTLTSGQASEARWLSRHTFVGHNADAATERPLWIRAFADVTDAALVNGGANASALPAGEQDAHVYGGEECWKGFDDTAENRHPNEYGWICSRNAWESWIPEDPNRVIVGDPFDLRDVDCHDMTLAPGAETGYPLRRVAECAPGLEDEVSQAVWEGVVPLIRDAAW